MKCLQRHSLLAALVVLSACGIDQGGVRGAGEPQATARTTLISGPITGFGSVLVNGLTLETSTAQIVVDGRPATESDLRAGQIIRAVASEDGGLMRARLIEYEESLVGPIVAVDAAAGQLFVLGHVIRVDAATQFYGFGTLDELTPAEPVEVSGFHRPAGEIVATYIGRTAPDRDFQLTASIAAVDAPNMSFSAGALTVDYSRVVMLDVAGGEPGQDAIVEVRGSELDQNVLIADAVRSLASLPGFLDTVATELTAEEAALTADGAATLGASFMGFVTALAVSELTLDSITVTIRADTVFLGGTADDLRLGGRIRVEGEITGPGLVAAERITLWN